MKINKYIATGLIFASAAGFTSCSDSFLDEHYTTGFSTAYFETPEGIQALTLSLYGHIRWIGGYESQGYHQFNAGTDEFGFGTDPCNEMWVTYDPRLAPSVATVNGNTATAQGVWDEVYYGIASANMIIAKANRIEDEALRNSCVAQAYFLRGYNYYLLTSQYGHCVIQTEPVEGIVRNFALTTPQECWEQVISDFRNAYELFTGETNDLAGVPVGWTKATAAHFLAKACLFAASERNSDWNSAYKDQYLNEGLQAANYAISARSLEPNVIDLYGNWTGVNCAIEKSNEVLMAAPQDDHFEGRTTVACRGTFFNPQFSNFASNVLVKRGCITGGKDFQRFRPTEYTLTVFDHVNDARLWRSFGTVYGASKEATSGDHTYKVGDPAIVFILNDKNEHKYDGFTFGSPTYQINGQENSNFVDVDGRIPVGGQRQPREGETVFGQPNTPVLHSWILYQNGEYQGDNFGNVANAVYVKGNNMYPGVTKHACGQQEALEGNNTSRDLILARLGETYLVRAEIKLRLNDYAGAKQDIDVLRRRGAWKQGENRAFYVDGAHASFTSGYVKGTVNEDAAHGWNMGTNSYYLSNPNLDVTYASTEAEMTDWTWDNLPAEDEAILANLGVSGQFDRALNFILNEHTRELVGEFVRWEHLSRTKTLATRAVKLNHDVVMFDANKHNLRPIPQTFLNQLQNSDGTNLSDADKAAWQNPGY